MLTIDFETKDPYISLGYGPGWVFALRGYTNPEFKLLGASIKIDDNEVYYETDLSKLARTISENLNYIVMHNCMYDIGCIMALFNQLGLDFNYKDTLFVDTMILAKIVDQSQFSYSLDNCSKRCGGQEKSKDTLTDYVWDSGLYQNWYKMEHGINKKTRPSESLLFNYAISNLDILPTEIVAEYCNFDVEATYQLHEILKNKLYPNLDLNVISNCIKALVEVKQRGVKVDLQQCNTTIDMLQSNIQSLTQEIYKIVGYEFNINSSQQLVDALKKIGITGFDTTKLGNDSASKTWLEDRPEDICKKIIKVKNYDKLCRDFLCKILKYQDIHIQNGSEDKRIFPNFNLFGATATGRMSSSGYKKDSLELNYQQIPKRGEDENAAKYVRAVFIPEENEKWVSADYSNQEQRLQVEYAHRLKLNGVTDLLKKMQTDPFIDFHKTVADICDVPRSAAKTINLGLSYSMGEVKLCNSLGLPTKWVKFHYGIREVAGDEAREVLDKYHKFLPFMKELQNICSETLQTAKYITTIDGRRLYLDKPHWDGKRQITFEYKGLSKLIQGSAAGVTMKAVSNCYLAGLKMLLIVHDEINITSAESARDKEVLRNCMENTFEMAVPMVVEISEGESWAA